MSSGSSQILALWTVFSMSMRASCGLPPTVTSAVVACQHETEAKCILHICSNTSISGNFLTLEQWPCEQSPQATINYSANPVFALGKVLALAQRKELLRTTERPPVWLSNRAGTRTQATGSVLLLLRHSSAVASLWAGKLSPRSRS